MLSSTHFVRSRLACAMALASIAMSTSAFADQYARGTQALAQMTGCYLVDYNYIETESLKSGYERDPRIYDVNFTRNVKEWIYSVAVSNNHIRIQHVLFATDASGQMIKGSELKHQAEDWEFNAPFLYDFTSPLHWDVMRLPTNRDQWTRRITNLDDGLRYQCSAPWNLESGYPEWSCANYSPIPGRETRDMGRRDYNTLQRDTRVIVYPTSWLERQDNVKVIYDNGVKTPLAREKGKNWYVRLPDSECSGVQDFIQDRQQFWILLRETWAQVLNGETPYLEKPPGNMPPRWARMMEVEDQFYRLDLSNPQIRENARSTILDVIRSYEP